MGRRGRSSSGGFGKTYFITTTVMDFMPIFDHGDNYYLILLDSLKFMLNKSLATLFAYVLMPSHVHFVVYIPEGVNVSDFMRDFKKFTSTKIRQQLESDSQKELVNFLRGNAIIKKRQIFKLWMDRFDDLMIESDKILRQKIEYIHNNPIRAGLVIKPEDWKYSSARNYSSQDHNMIEVAVDWSIRKL